MACDNVKYGFWLDYDRPLLNKCQILLSDWWVAILTNTIAVLITSVVGPMFVLSVGPYNWLWGKITSSWTNAQAATLQTTYDLEERISIVLNNLRNDGFVTIPLGVPLSPIRGRRAAMVFGTATMMLIILGLPVALIVASIVSSGLATTAIGLLDSTACGIYAFNKSHALGMSVQYDQKAELEANTYAIDCYGPSPIATCDRFYTPKIGYDVNPGPCPFAGDVCHSEVNSSVRFSTNLTSSSVLGINAERPLFFRREMTCSPLITREPYVRTGLSERGEAQWEYWYGSSLGKYTTVNPIQDSLWEIKGYSTSVHWSDPMAKRSPYQPLDEFTSGSNPVTLMFISSHSVFYPAQRNDVVFPARTKSTFPRDRAGTELYYNNSTRAGVLGCVDQYQVCTEVNGPCWDNSNITKLLNNLDAESQYEHQKVVWLLLLALKYSTAAGSTQFRGPEALDAQSKIAHMLSLPLAVEQWKVEAERMFQTSLARMQLNLYDFVRGTAYKYEGYYNTLPLKYRSMCQMVKVPVNGRKNINLVGLLGTAIAVVLVWVMGKKRRNDLGEEELVADVVWRCLAFVCSYVWLFLRAITVGLRKLLFWFLEYIGSVLERCVT